MRTEDDSKNNKWNLACPIKFRPALYRLAGNKIGKNCYLSPRIFLGPDSGKLFVWDCV